MSTNISILYSTAKHFSRFAVCKLFVNIERIKLPGIRQQICDCKSRRGSDLVPVPINKLRSRFLSELNDVALEKSQGTKADKYGLM